MTVFNQAKSALSGANLDSERVATINAKFTSYLGTNIRGAQVKALCETVQNNNNTADEDQTYTVTLIFGTGDGVTEASEIDTIKNQISSGKNYTVTATYEGPSKTIDTITITGPNK
jgi:hypothetical protein